MLTWPFFSASRNFVLTWPFFSAIKLLPTLPFFGAAKLLLTWPFFAAEKLLPTLPFFTVAANLTVFCCRKIAANFTVFCCSKISANFTDLTSPSRNGKFKTCVKRSLSKIQKLVSNTNYRLKQVKRFAECSKGSNLQYFRPSLSCHLSLRSLFCLFLSGRLSQVLLYMYSVNLKPSLVFNWWP